MLQRIQTVYWLLSVVCLGILLSGVKLVTFKKENQIFELTIYKLNQINPSNGKVETSGNNYHFLIVLLLIVFILFTIFSFKSLKKQLNLSKWVMSSLLTFILIFFTFSYTGQIVNNSSEISFNFSSAFLLIGFVFSVLAYLGVRKDKSLLDSVDRIR